MTDPTTATSPAWLARLLQDHTEPRKLFAWTPENLGLGRAGQERQAVATTSAGSDYDDDRIHILGIGNLGRLYAHCLAQLPGRPAITLVVHRRDQLEQWAVRPGVELARAGAPAETISDFDIEWWADEAPARGPVREVAGGGVVANLLVATKATDALPQVDRARRYLDARSAVLFVQNGMSRLWPPLGARYAGCRFAPGRHPSFLVGVTTHGVTSAGPFSSVHASPADVVLGPVLPNDAAPDRSRYLVRSLVRAPHLSGREVPRSELWALQLEKLVVNSVINPLTAVLRCRNGTLFLEPVIITIMDRLVNEASAVLQSLVLHRTTSEIFNTTNTTTIMVAPGSPGELSKSQRGGIAREGLLERFAPHNLRAMLHRVGDKVRDNYSSMLQDVRAGKETEIGEFNGWLVDTAADLDGHLDVFSHRRLIELVEQGMVMEHGELGRWLLPS